MITLEKGKNMITLEKGKIYKIKEFLNWDNQYIIICPRVTRTIKSDSYIPCLFKCHGKSNSRKIQIKTYGNIMEAFVNVNSYRFKMKKISIKEYNKIGELLKKEGYRYDKRNKRLIRL